MILLDENVPEGQRVALRRWKPLQIGVDLWKKGTKDEQIAVRLREERNVTFFTLDSDFFDLREQYGHPRCAMVFVDAPMSNFAALVDRFLRHSAFRTHSSRMGSVIRITPKLIASWRRSSAALIEVVW